MEELCNNAIADLDAQASKAMAMAAKKRAAWRKAMVYQLLAPEQIANATSAMNNASNTSKYDFAMLSTRDQLIDAFGSFTGMDRSWFINLTDTPALMSARKIKGQGGITPIAEPLFCPFEVMQWLASSKRRKGRKLGAAKAWELLEKRFPRVYSAYSIGDPRFAD